MADYDLMCPLGYGAIRFVGGTGSRGEGDPNRLQPLLLDDKNTQTEVAIFSRN